MVQNATKRAAQRKSPEANKRQRNASQDEKRRRQAKRGPKPDECILCIDFGNSNTVVAFRDGKDDYVKSLADKKLSDSTLIDFGSDHKRISSLVYIASDGESLSVHFGDQDFGRNNNVAQVFGLKLIVGRRRPDEVRKDVIDINYRSGIGLAAIDGVDGGIDLVFKELRISAKEVMMRFIMYIATMYVNHQTSAEHAKKLIVVATLPCDFAQSTANVYVDIIKKAWPGAEVICVAEPDAAVMQSLKVSPVRKGKCMAIIVDIGNGTTDLVLLYVTREGNHTSITKITSKCINSVAGIHYTTSVQGAVCDQVVSKGGRCDDNTFKLIEVERVKEYLSNACVSELSTRSQVSTRHKQAAASSASASAASSSNEIKFSFVLSSKRHNDLNQMYNINTSMLTMDRDTFIEVFDKQNAVLKSELIRFYEDAVITHEHAGADKILVLVGGAAMGLRVKDTVMEALGLATTRVDPFEMVARGGILIGLQHLATAAEAEVASGIEVASGTEAEAEAEVKVASGTEAEAEAEVKVASGAEAEAEVNVASGTEAEAEAEVKVASGAEAEVKVASGAEAEAEAEVKVASGAEAEAGGDANVASGAEPEAWPWAGAEPSLNNIGLTSLFAEGVDDIADDGISPHKYPAIHHGDHPMDEVAKAEGDGVDDDGDDTVTNDSVTNDGESDDDDDEEEEIVSFQDVTLHTSYGLVYRNAAAEEFVNILVRKDAKIPVTGTATVDLVADEMVMIGEGSYGMRVDILEGVNLEDNAPLSQLVRGSYVTYKAIATATRNANGQKFSLRIDIEHGKRPTLTMQIGDDEVTAAVGKAVAPRPPKRKNARK
jgi:hypothetical protein